MKQATDIAASPDPSPEQARSHASSDNNPPSQPTPIDVERSKAAEQVPAQSVSNMSLDHSSVNPKSSSKPPLLPAAFMSGSTSQLSTPAAAKWSSQHASVGAIMPPFALQTSASPESNSQRCLHQPAVAIPHQLDFLLTDDPVGTAIAEANKVVANRAGLMSLADQQREALNLHVQAKDTYFAAAQTAHEKGTLLQLCNMFSLTPPTDTWICASLGRVSRDPSKLTFCTLCLA